MTDGGDTPAGRRSAPFVLPEALVAALAGEGPAARQWLAGLPAAVASLRRRWGLAVGPPYRPGGATAWVAPALDRTRTPLVLKVGRAHPEAAAEAAGLRLWDGTGAVVLRDEARLGDTVGLLLERCEPGTPLRSRPEAEQDLVVTGLLPRLWRDPPPGHPFPLLASMCDAWATEAERGLSYRPGLLDPGLARHGVSLFRSLPLDGPRPVVLCTDLHAGNVLAARREPWLAIDPKPHVGDPTYDPLQHMLNCDARLSADPHGLVRTMADPLGLDRDRLRAWLLARCVVEAHHRPGLATVVATLA